MLVMIREVYKVYKKNLIEVALSVLVNMWKSNNSLTQPLSFSMGLFATILRAAFLLLLAAWLLAVPDTVIARARCAELDVLLWLLAEATG